MSWWPFDVAAMYILNSCGSHSYMPAGDNAVNRTRANDIGLCDGTETHTANFEVPRNFLSTFGQNDVTLRVCVTEIDTINNNVKESNPKYMFHAVFSFSHTIILHLYIFIPIFIVSPNSLGLMLFVCSWCDKNKVYLILSMNSHCSHSPEMLNSGKHCPFFVGYDLEIWPWKIIRHLFYATSRFVHYIITIGEFKLQLQSGNAQFGSKLAILVLRDLEIWQMTLINNRAALICHIKLCASFPRNMWIQTGVTFRKRLNCVLTSVTLTFDPRP